MQEPDTTRIAILFQGSVLMPTASANRVKSYTEGLLSNNCMVTTFNMHPVPKKEANDFSSGYLDNYEFNLVDKEPGLLKRKYYYLKFFIRKSKEYNKYSHLFFYGHSHFFILYLFVFSRLFGKKLLFEGSEYPLNIIKNRKIFKFLNIISVNIIFKLFDGGIVVSNNLYNYYKKKGHKNLKLIKIPIMVDPERFENIQNLDIPLPKEYIAYCGTMYGDKDGVPDLLKSMSIIKKQFPELKLLLIGDNKNLKLISPLLQLIKEYNLGDIVIFTGIVDKKNIPFYLSNAKLLVLSRPDNLQAQGGFPTKLGEYLLSGRPVVVTRVGEIQDYLTDGVTAFLVEAGSAEKFAQKIKEALENSDLSEMIAKKGKELALEKFGIKEHGIRLSQFFCTELRCNN